ncbi:MAG: ygiY [Massilia sp.]|jgi:two-component system sensor histidine kinase QseC|nr:ygiY [Massilia sp.]MDB5950413.1 ygiY [Massilia sp.]
MPKPLPEGQYSLRRRLLWVILGSSVVLWVASLSIIAVIAWRETNDVFDDALKESGYLIMAATTDWNERGLPSDGGASGRVAGKVEIQYQIVVDGKVIQRTGGAPVDPFVAAFAKKKGFENILVGAKKWRVFVTRSADQHSMVQVGQEYKKRLDILGELAEHLMVPALALLLLLALVSWFFIGRVIRPINNTAKAVAQKSGDDLSLLATANQPAELLPVIDAVNGMLSRLDAALQAERRFTADAAHELRTPLAGVHMHVQLLQRQHPALAASFQKLRRDVERSTSLVDSLLTLSRLDPIGSTDLERSKVAFAPLFQDIVRVHEGAAAERNIRIGVDCGLDHVCANADMLRIVLRNLVDNALRYCTPDSRIILKANWNNGAARLSVCDNGPGVTLENRARLTERFFRVLGSDQGGSGLGLSIVKRIVELHGATLQFGAGDGGRGLAVMIDFPADPAPA